MRTNWKKKLTSKRYEEFKVERTKAFFEFQKVYRKPSKINEYLPILSEEDFFSLDIEETRDLFKKNLFIEDSRDLFKKNLFIEDSYLNNKISDEDFFSSL